MHLNQLDLDLFMTMQKVPAKTNEVASNSFHTPMLPLTQGVQSLTSISLGPVHTTDKKLHFWYIHNSGIPRSNANGSWIEI